MDFSPKCSRHRHLSHAVCLPPDPRTNPPFCNGSHSPLLIKDFAPVIISTPASSLLLFFSGSLPRENIWHASILEKPWLDPISIRLLFILKLSPSQGRCLPELSTLSVCSYSLLFFFLQRSSPRATITPKLLNPVITVQAKNNLTLQQLLRLSIILFISIQLLYLAFTKPLTYLFGFQSNSLAFDLAECSCSQPGPAT